MATPYPAYKISKFATPCILILTSFPCMFACGWNIYALYIASFWLNFYTIKSLTLTPFTLTFTYKLFVGEKFPHTIYGKIGVKS